MHVTTLIKSKGEKVRIVCFSTEGSDFTQCPQLIWLRFSLRGTQFGSFFFSLHINMVESTNPFIINFPIREWFAVFTECGSLNMGVCGISPTFGTRLKWPLKELQVLCGFISQFWSTCSDNREATLRAATQSKPEPLRAVKDFPLLQVR